jgi:hypothetical protein
VPLAPTPFRSTARRVQTGVSSDGARVVLARPLARASPEHRTRATA